MTHGRVAFTILAMPVLFLSACRTQGEREGTASPVVITEGEYWGPGLGRTGMPKSAGPGGLDSLRRASEAAGPLPLIPIAYPRNRTIFPPDFAPPTFSWMDSAGRADFWLLTVSLDSSFLLGTVTQSPRLPQPRIDSTTIPPKGGMEIPDPNRFKNWTPSAEVWEVLKEATREKWGRLTVVGFKRGQPYTPVARAGLDFRTSSDSVTYPIFYRDVPIMPTKNESGRVQPLPKTAQKLIHWSLRDVSRPAGKTVISNLPTCANCHSFSRNGKYMGFDLDGPQSDKGTYGVGRLEANTKIAREDVFSWNRDFPGRMKGKKTIGFLSQISPDGRFVVTTVNEAVYIHNYMNSRYIQVFYPTRGVLAVHDKATGSIRLLPGADDTAYVHCDPTWSPDGRYIVFARARAMDPYRPGQPDPEYPNDPNETQIQYGLYRIPFNAGKGGVASAIAGASDNGMSNSFPKVSPDGKFIVFVKCKNGQLLRPDGRLWIVPAQGGEARLMDCNLEEMNSWHSFSPSGRWMVFSSKGLSWYTQMFLTHIDEDGQASPPVLIPNATAANRAVNLPEFVNVRYASLEKIEIPALRHMEFLQQAYDLADSAKPVEARKKMEQALAEEKQDHKFRSEVQVLLAWLQDSLPDMISVARTAVRTDPENPSAYFSLGSLLERGGDVVAAAECYRKSIALSPEDAWAFVSLARIHMQSADSGLRNLPKAVELAEKANSIAKYREPSVMKTLARAYSEVGRFEEARSTALSGLTLARQQNLQKEIRELEVEAEVYRMGKAYSWALKNSQRP